MSNIKILFENKKAYYDYEILEKFEGGIVLFGQEVKSLKTRSVNLAGTYADIKNSAKGNPEIFWLGAKIFPYQPKNAPSDYNPERPRKILLKKSEIKYLIGKQKEKRLALIPLKIYIKNGKIKLEIGVAKGKKRYDKREIIKKRETKREIQRILKSQI